MAYEDDNVISEGAEYSSKSEFSKPAVCQSAVTRCAELRSKEMIPGFFNYSTSEGKLVRTWISDPRKNYIGSIKALISLLTPEILLNKDIEDEMATFEEREEKLFEDYAYEDYDENIDKDQKTFWKKNEIKYLPDIDAMVIIKTPRGLAEERKGGWNKKTNLYWQEMVKLHDEIFATLNKLVDNLNYFKSTVSY